MQPEAAPASVEESPGDDNDLEDILARLGSETAEQPGKSPSVGPANAAPVPKTGDKLTDPRDLTRPSSASDVVIDVGAGIGFDPSFASFGQRALGAIVDTVVVTAAAIPGLVVFQLGDGAAFAVLAIAVALLGLLVVVVLGGRAIAKNGKWIGNRVAGTTVVDAITGSYVDSSRAGFRMLARHVISPIFMFGYLVAFADGQRRTFHDRLAGTVVIRPQREVWTADDE